MGSGIVVGAVAVLLGVFIHSGIASRVAAESALVHETREAAVQDVSVTHAKLSDATEEVVLPGNIQAFTDSPIYARTNGYLKRWYADIGTRVSAGQLLAEIDTPEVDQQLQQARADLETAQANYKLAQSTAARWQFLLKSQSVSQQETDEKVGDLNAKKAMVDSAASNVRRLEDLQSYEKVYAPFDGVITARDTDIGALVSAGSTSGHELFHLASINRLRVFVSVPEVDQRAARSGARADLTLTEFPGRTFPGAIARNSSAIDPASRTLLVEVDVNNPSRELLPGAYVSVHLKMPSKVQALTIPVNTMLFRSEGLRVAVVRDNRAQLTPITIGRDFGNEVEVVAGLRPSDPIIVNPPDSLVAGAKVRVTGAIQ
ncbi:MAG TPA: efflux RND transporter periplasmic adaptor subunit [Bryobacteraceae bacterium]|nr:efflux RND transporter periplasmic adaptor subunit [Bryobacteraceae bacterium]